MYTIFSLVLLLSLIIVQKLDTNGSVTQLVTLPPLAIQLYKSL
jgi:hypothetical protein